MPDSSDRRALPRLSDLDLRAGAAQRLKVCVVTSEIMGPTRNGGIGTATSGLVEHLAADGHEVTLLYTQVWRGTPLCTERSWEHWVREFRARGIELRHIPHGGDYADWRHKSWLVKDALAEGGHDLVYFNEHHGSGYYALAAKRAGLAPFAEQVHCVITHGAIEWVLETNDQYIERRSDLEMIGFERRSVEWADVVIGPSEYLLREYARYGWRLPPRTFCQPYPLFRAPAACDAEPRAVDEIVFFGRLEPRKGLWLFCEALELLGERLRGRTVTFMGRMTEISGHSSGALLAARAARWPFRMRLLTRLGPPQALAYLAGPGRLAVMPSLADNSPCVVYECMENAIPFVTTLGSGADELIDPGCWPDVMVAPTADALARRLEAILDGGARLARPRFDPAENLRTWTAWHDALSAEPARFRAAPAEPATAPDAADPEVPAILILTIDPDGRSLGALLDGMATHFRRFGAAAGHLLLTRAGGPVRGLLAELLAAPAEAAETSVLVLGQDELAEARQLLLDADIVIGTATGCEIQTTFLANVVRLFSAGCAAAASCVIATPGRDGDDPVVESLPAGDVPAVGALRGSVASELWAVSVPALRDELASLALDEPDHGELVSAEWVGHAVAQRCMLSGKPYLLLPILGGVRAATVGPTDGDRHWYRIAARTAGDLGLATVVHPGAAPWFASLAQGRGPGASGGAWPAPELASLPAAHPLRMVPATGDTDTAERLAAALGRPGTALQVRMALRRDVGGIAETLELAHRACALRPVLDLLAVMRRGVERLDPALPQPASESRLDALRDRLVARALARRGLGDPGPEDGSGSPVSAPGEDVAAAPAAGTPRAYSRGLDCTTVEGTVRLSPARAGGPPWRLVFIDLPLAGHRRLVAGLRGVGAGATTVRLALLDQVHGIELAAGEMAVAARGTELLEIELPGVHGPACLVVSSASPEHRHAAGLAELAIL
ncbi:MAG: glycosyltransferase family 4 protein [Dongiaceae bacterium]